MEIAAPKIQQPKKASNPKRFYIYVDDIDVDEIVIVKGGRQNESKNIKNSSES